MLDFEISYYYKNEIENINNDDNDMDIENENYETDSNL